MLASQPGADSAAPPEPATQGEPEGAAPLLRDDPRAIGPYTVIGRLGAGGMGTVYLGRSDKGRRVAIKVIRPELAEDEAFVRRFHHEVAAARRVAGFCTARVLDAGLDVPRPYLVTEYVEGLRLDHAVERDGPLDDSGLEGFAVGVAAALTAIHSAGVIHRDLKPGNVLLSRFGPKVIDFGIARALDETSVLTRISSIMGTPGWMAPEQFEKRPATPATDVFAWGGLVAFAATGLQPYGDGPLATIAYRVMHEPVDLSGVHDDKLRRVVESALRKDPAARPTAREILLDLLGEEEGGDTGEAVTTALQRTWSGPSPVAPVVREHNVTPVDVAAAAAAVVSTSAVAATAAEARDAADREALDAAAAAAPTAAPTTEAVSATTRTVDGPPPATRPVQPVRPVGERLLPAAGKPMPPEAGPPAQAPRRPDPNRPLPSAGLPMRERPPRQRSARTSPGGDAPAPAWGQPPAAPAGYANGPYAPPRQGQPSYGDPYRQPQHQPGQGGHPPPGGQARQGQASPQWGRPPVQQRPQGQPPAWQQQGGPPAVRQPGPPRPGTYPPQGQPHAQAPHASPTMGYRVRRWFAFLFAWSALLGAALGYAGRSQASGEFIRTRELAGALGLLFGVLTVAYLLLPASRQRRGRAITARIIGLLAIAAAIGAGSEALPVGDSTLFIESLRGPFIVLAISIFVYPKDRARPPADH